MADASRDAGSDAGMVADSGTGDAGTDADAGAFVDCAEVTVTAVPEELGLDPFYDKHVDADGIPIVSSDRVRDSAFAVARDIIVHMLSRRPDVRDALIGAEVRIGIMSQDEVTTDMPEHSDLYEAFPGTDWDTRARGLSATLERPLTSVGEENLLGLPDDRYAGESILVHEFGHTVWELGIRRLPGGSEAQADLMAAYDAAIAAGTYTDTYAATDVREYWAEGVQGWFDTNLEAIPADGVHNEIDTRAELRASDPTLAGLMEEVFGDGDWRPMCEPR